MSDLVFLKHHKKSILIFSKLASYFLFSTGFPNPKVMLIRGIPEPRKSIRVINPFGVGVLQSLCTMGMPSSIIINEFINTFTALAGRRSLLKADYTFYFYIL